MDEETKKEIYREISKRFFEKFDTYIMKHWAKLPEHIEFTVKEREKVFKKFYGCVKKEQVASKATMQRWFGLGGEKKPTRKQFLKAAFALRLSSDECNEYLMYALSEPELQVNDYQEFTAMYALDHRLPWCEYEKMLCFFEEHYAEEIHFLHTIHTDALKKFYRKLREASEEEFLLWLCKNMELFKGYSKVTYDFFCDLMDEVYECIREEAKEKLFFNLSETDFFRWGKERNVSEADYGTAIPRYVKNMLRRRDCTEEDRIHLKEIRYYSALVYATESNMSQVLSELLGEMGVGNPADSTDVFAVMNEKKENQANGISEIFAEVKKMDLPYISNLFRIAEQKEENLRLSKKIRSAEGDEKQEIRKTLMHQSQRVKQIQRKDLLLPVQYIIQKKYQKEHGTDYIPDEAKAEFRNMADHILEACGMRKLDEHYELDYILLECFGEEEMILFAEVFEDNE